MITVALSLLAMSQNSTSNLPFLSPMMSDHMVLQRGKTNTFWGWTTPGTTVTVEVAGKKGSGKADASGRWQAKFTPPPAGGPYEVTVKGPKKVTLHDVLVGDVWLCGGQSNMEFGLTMAENHEEAIKNANNPNIRLFMVPRAVGLDPHPVPAGGTWYECTPESVQQGGWGGFSAVGYFFGKRIQQDIKVPVGLISVNWGGTSAEAWTSEASVNKMGDWEPVMKQIAELKKRGEPDVGTYPDIWMEYEDRLSMTKPHPEATGYDDSSWKSAPLSTGFDALGAKSGQGIVWFRRSVTLPNPLPDGPVQVHIGPINQADHTFLNGTIVGSTWGNWPRTYWPMPGVAKPGRNVIAVRMAATDGKGGSTGGADSNYIQLGDGTKIPLDGDWKAAVSYALEPGGAKPHEMASYPTSPCGLYNGMLSPIAPLAIKGAIWYQGETNGGRGYQYRTLLPTMINDWRTVFGQGDFPFYIVSLAAWGQPPQKPGDDGWAELREAQALTAKNVKNSGLALAIDVGNAGDIHPKDKLTVGNRLAFVALAQTYGEKIPYAGPTYASKEITGGNIILSFKHADGGLVCKGDALKSFMIAGEDKVWHWADAKIVGVKILVHSDEVSNPVAVRYGWAMNPECNLFNGAGLPAVPFRTDDWPLTSRNNKW